MEFTNLEAQKTTADPENPPPKNYSSTDNNTAIGAASEPPSKKKKRTAQQDTPKTKGLCGTSLVYDDMYVVRYWEGRLKVVELLLTCVAMVILPGVIDAYYIR